MEQSFTGAESNIFAHLLISFTNGPVDQPGRSPALQAGGLGFKSRRVHKIFGKNFMYPSVSSGKLRFPCGPDGSITKTIDPLDAFV